MVSPVPLRLLFHCCVYSLKPLRLVLLTYALSCAFGDINPKHYCQNQSEGACPCLTLLGYRCVSPCLPFHSFACGCLVFTMWNVDKTLLLHVFLALVLHGSWLDRCDNTCALAIHSCLWEEGVLCSYMDLFWALCLILLLYDLVLWYAHGVLITIAL